MKKVLLTITLFLLQNYLILQGAVVFGKLVAPFLILGVSAAILVLYYSILLRPFTTEETYTAKPGYRAIGAATLNILLIDGYKAAMPNTATAGGGVIHCISKSHTGIADAGVAFRRSCFIPSLAKQDQLHRL